MSDELTAQPFWVQSYIIFWKYANFGVSLQNIGEKTKNVVVNRMGSASNGQNQLRIMSFKNSYRVQSYTFFCRYANFGVSLQNILTLL